MKQYLLPQNNRFYKANLHMHSVISDGRFTVEEIKAAYKAEGYSIVAFTDHEIMVDHSDLNDEDFLAITSYEINVDQKDVPGGKEFIKTYHLNFFAKNPHETYYPCCNPKYIWGNARNYINDSIKGDYERVYNIECVNEIIKDAVDHGFLVSYNHPSWSTQGYKDYEGISGIFGVEIYNTGCVRDGWCEDATPHVFEDFLRMSKRVYPLATDDAHKMKDCFGGFVMVSSPKLEYGSIMKALETGDFYASYGPTLNELYIEDGILNIASSDVREIVVTTERRKTWNIAAPKGETVNRAVFDLNDFINKSYTYGTESESYFRVTLIDKEGNKALSRAYFVDELMK